MAMIRWGTVTSLALSLAGCATSFTGNAHVENGRAGCEEKCRGQGMQIAGMVYMGEYSSACVCEVPHGSASGRRDMLVSGGAGASGAAAGVMMQMSRQQQQQHNTFVFR
jgi:hypothetical protein